MNIHTKAIFWIIIFLLVADSFGLPLNISSSVKAQTADVTDLADDFQYFQKYSQYLNYQKKLQYQNYLVFKKNKKYNIPSASNQAKYKIAHDNYQLYLGNPMTYPQFKTLKKQYLKYENYLNKYLPNVQYAGYKSYKRYNKKKYDAGANFGTEEYKAGYDRYLLAQNGSSLGLGEADLGSGILGLDGKYLGPEIKVGLANYSRTQLQDNAFQITAFSASTGNPTDYVINDGNGNLIAQVTAGEETKVKYNSNKTFRIYNSLPADQVVANEVRFEAADGVSPADIVFDFNNPSNSFDQYRGKIALKYYDDPINTDSIWAINSLPIEQYVWGIGEMAGTGPMDHSQVMTTVFRTYGYWKAKFSTKYAGAGFHVNATPGNQLYYGYQWETGHPNIRKAAENTQGKLVMYSSGKNEIALTPYSSWTDGKTRSFLERWGSDDYPWCQSVKDPYGKHPTMTTQQLLDSGNHMVGLSAHGSLNLADTKYDWDWSRILIYYYKGINLLKAY